MYNVVQEDSCIESSPRTIIILQTGQKKKNSFYTRIAFLWLSSRWLKRGRPEASGWVLPPPHSPSRQLKVLWT